jgi:hypothetical protein
VNARVEQVVQDAVDARQQAADAKAVDAARTARNAAILTAFVLAAAALIAAVTYYDEAVNSGGDRDQGCTFASLRYHG